MSREEQKSRSLYLSLTILQERTRKVWQWSPSLHSTLRYIWACKRTSTLQMRVVPYGRQPCLAFAKKCGRTQPMHSFITTLPFPDVQLMSEARKYIAYSPHVFLKKGPDKCAWSLQTTPKIGLIPRRRMVLLQ